MAIANQGYRRDLNLKETTDDTVALDNLAGSGTASDLSYIQNNLRNRSSVSFNSITSDGFFSFENDRQITINGLSAEGMLHLQLSQYFYLTHTCLNLVILLNYLV